MQYGERIKVAHRAPWANFFLVFFFFWTFGPEKPKIWVEMGIFLSKNHEISGARNHVLDPHRCSKVSNSGFNGLKSSKLALYRREKKFARVPFYKWVIL